MATIKDIAKMLDLGVSTVSMALNNNPKINKNTRELVINTANEIGYIKSGIAVDLQKQKTNVILVVITDASRSYFSKFLSVVQREVAKYGYDLLIATLENSSKTAERYISEHRVDGVIIYTNLIGEDFLRKYAHKDFPICVVGHYVEGDNIYCTFPVKEPTLGISATNYLIAKGHRNIAFVKASSSTLGTPRRLNGYKKVLLSNNIPIDESLIYDAKDSTFEAGYNVTKKIIKDIDKIDAIYYSNDDIAIGGLKALKDANIDVPNDISIIGNNNLPESSLVTPSLTTVASNIEIDTKNIVKILIKAINKEPIDKKALEKTYYNATELIIERDSVKSKKK
ncbi:MAG: LacI family transcriptional regulator [Erysipelotrichaceae bacterium]|nr:LacI family transcriptional regulator [Erysipelotrichaceae bacterium]